MNKKLLATAMGVALAGAMSTANASVKIYGYLNGSYDFYNHSKTSYACDTGTCTSKSGSGFSSNSTNFGLKGSEDLGGGNAFIWQVESGFDLNGSGGSIGTRNTFAGFHGDWGTVFAGKHDSAMKMADTSVMPWNNTISDSRNIMGSNAAGGNVLNQRFGRVLAYVSPNMMGLTGYAIYVGGNPTSYDLATGKMATVAHESGNTKSGGYDLAVNYHNGPIEAWVAYEKQYTDITNADLNAERISGSYNLHPFKVGAIFEHMSADATNSIDSHNAWGLFGMMNMGMNSVGLAYYKADSSSGSSSNGADMWTLAAYHHFTKRTDVYAEYAQVSNDSNAQYALGGGGHGDLIPAAAPGSNPSAFSVGFEHKF